MKQELNNTVSPSEFKALEGIEYFDFEEEFVGQNMRCIPMIVRFKMDAAGIKLRLSEWSKFKKEERIDLALRPCKTAGEVKSFNYYLAGLIKQYTGHGATVLPTIQNPEWAELKTVPALLHERIKRIGLLINTDQWKSLTDLQRFALIKLCKEGHENKNLPKAIKEFNLINW